MTAPLYSSRWHQLAELRPRWRVHARCDRQTIRGETWYVAVGDGRPQGLRLDAVAWLIAGRCDGRSTVAEIWAAALAEDPDRAPTQDQTIELIARLVQECCLDCPGLPRVAVLHADDAQRVRRERWARLNPLAPRLALGDPSPGLRPLAPLGQALFGPVGACLVLFVLAWALAQCVQEAEALWRHGHTWLQTPRYLALAWLVWWPMKAVHELAHGLAVQRWGGQVREAGVSLMLGWPVPYVDASAADRFVFAYQRAVVSAAGIVAELVLAALGLWVWVVAEPGWVRDVGFAVAAAGVVSTFLFNANPLVRMDGYFVLCDVAGLPNLASRSSAFWVAAVQRALGWSEAVGPRLAPRERAWLWAYAPLAWMWRASMMVTVAWWAGAWHPAFAYAVWALAGWWLAWRPVAAVLHGPGRAGAAWAVRWRFQGRAVLVAGLMAVVLLGVPLPDRTLALAVVQPPEDSVLRAGVDGMIRTARPEGPVPAGTVVLELEDPTVQQQREGLEQQRQGLEAEWLAALRTDPARAAQAQERLQGVEASLAEAQRRQAAQQVTVRAAGTLSWQRGDDWPGAFVREGDVLGHVLDERPPSVRVVLDQDDAARARLTPPQALSVRLAERAAPALPARLLRHVPAAISALPAPGLSDRLGGSVPVAPQDPDGLRPAYPTYVLDLAVDWPPGPPPRIGGRAWVRLDYGARPLAQQWWRALSQTVRARLGAQGA